MNLYRAGNGVKTITYEQEVINFLLNYLGSSSFCYCNSGKRVLCNFVKCHADNTDLIFLKEKRAIKVEIFIQPVTGDYIMVKLIRETLNR